MPLDDDPSIAAGTELWRRVDPAWLTPDGQGGLRPSSITFQDRRSGEVSVYIGAETDPARVLRAYVTHSIAAFDAGIIRSLDGYSISRDPTAEFPSHALIWPTLSKTAAKRIAAACTWVVPPRTP